MMSRIAFATALVVMGMFAPAATAGADPAPPPPPPGPKTSFGDGTYNVGTDIAPGVYQSAGPVDGGGACYWKRSNGDGIVANAMSKKPQTVQIEAGDTTFKSSECQEWQKTDAAPPPPPGPADILSQLAPLIAAGGAPSPGANTPNAGAAPSGGG
jgi:hypothetical protein